MHYGKLWKAVKIYEKMLFIQKPATVGMTVLGINLDLSELSTYINQLSMLTRKHRLNTGTFLSQHIFMSPTIMSYLLLNLDEIKSSDRCSFYWRYKHQGKLWKSLGECSLYIHIPSQICF